MRIGIVVSVLEECPTKEARMPAETGEGADPGEGKRGGNDRLCSVSWRGSLARLGGECSLGAGKPDVVKKEQTDVVYPPCLKWGREARCIRPSCEGVMYTAHA